MGVYISFIFGGLAIILSYKTNADFLFWIAIVTTAINFCTWCLMSYCAWRAGYVEAAPDWAAHINIITTILLAIILVYSLFLLQSLYFRLKHILPFKEPVKNQTQLFCLYVMTRVKLHKKNSFRIHPRQREHIFFASV